MQSIIEKLQSILDRLQDEENREVGYSSSFITNSNNNEIRLKTMRLLSGFITYLKLDKPEVFLEFKKLAWLFQNINININDQLMIISYLIEVNAILDDSAPDERILLPNVDAIMDYDYKYMDCDELYDILCENRLDEFLDDETIPNKQGKREVRRRYEETKLDFTHLQHACNKLYVILEKKEEDISYADYQIIIENMSIIHFGYLAHRLVKKIKKHLELSERKGEVESELKEEIPPLEVIKPKYSRKQINQVHYEISKLYDLEHYKEKTSLSLDEIIYLLSLMYSVEMEEKTIQKFLSSVMRTYHKNNPFCIFYQSYNKYKSLALPEINAHIEMIEYILSEVNIFICSTEKYRETKELVQEELDAIINILSDNYTYEIETAKMLLKEQEGDNYGSDN